MQAALRDNRLRPAIAAGAGLPGIALAGSGTPAAQYSLTVTFARPGSYAFRCRYHASQLPVARQRWHGRRSCRLVTWQAGTEFARGQCPAPGPGVHPVSGPGYSGRRDDLDDTALVGLVGKADRGALEVLYQRHGAICYRLARRVTANDVLAEDAVQETFAGLWRNPAAYLPGRGSVRGWLLGLAHHKAVDLVRRETAQQRRRNAQAAQQAVDPPAAGDPAAAAWAGIRAQAVRAALSELPEPQRRALALAYFGGYSQSEIAQLTGAPLGTVKMRMFAAMRRLQLRLPDLADRPGEDSS